MSICFASFGQVTSSFTNFRHFLMWYAKAAVKEHVTGVNCGKLFSSIIFFAYTLGRKRFLSGFLFLMVAEFFPFFTSLF